MQRSPISNHQSTIYNVRSLAGLLLIALSACSPQAPATPTPLIATPFLASPVLPTDLPQPTDTPTPVPVAARAQYSMNVVLDYAAKSVSVDESIVYPNHTGQPLNDLLLAVEPNFWPGCFTLSALTLDDTAVTDYSFDAQKLSIPLPAVLPPEGVVTLKIQYTLALPEAVQPDRNVARPRIFGYNDFQVNLTNWYPFVVPYLNGQWVLHDPWYYGEHLVYDSADYVVNVRPADPAAKLVIASSGSAGQSGEWTTYTLTAGRAFALSASNQYDTVSTQVGDVTVTSYYVTYIYQSSAQVAMNAAAHAIQVYTDRYGPYPHKTLAVVMGNFDDGMEFSSFFFLGRSFYNLYDGTPNGYLTAVTVHETAHQWWFEQVASDQAAQPWLDEALATYSEHIYYEAAAPQSITQWWWPARVGLYPSEGWVDTPVNATASEPKYWSAVYFRGAHFLDDLRGRIGDEAFFAFLKDYLAQENGKIASSSDFFRILSAHTSADLTDIVRQYFQNTY